MLGIGRGLIHTGGIALLIALAGCAGAPAADGPVLALSAEQLNFGDVAVGHPRSLSVMVWNQGDEPLVVDDVTTSGDGFSTSTSLASALELGPGEGSWIDVWFDPAAAGPSIGSLAVHSNDPTDPVRQVTFLGIGVTAALSVDAEGGLVFGPATPGSAVFESVTVSSTGAAAAELLAAELSDGDADFWIDSVHPDVPTVLDPGETAVVVVGYTAGIGANGTLQLLSDVPSLPIIEVALIGEAAQSSPDCEVLQPQAEELVEGTVFDLQAIALDAESAPAELEASWSDHFDGEPLEVCSAAPDELGTVACEHVAQGVGPHTLTFRAQDPSGRSCEEQRVVVVTEDDPPQSAITTPGGAQVVEDGTCVGFSGVVHDDEDGDSLEVTWWSDHPDAPDPLFTGWSEPDGATSVTACDLPCGAQVVYLTVVDSGGQVAADGVDVDVTLLEPTLDPVDDREVVLGQQAEFTFTAVGSCGLTPVLSFDGYPPGAAVTADGFTYQPTYDPLDNPVGTTVTVDVHSEVSLGADTRTDTVSFDITVLSDEYLAVSGEQPTHVRLFPGLYDGTFGAVEVEVLAADLRPVAVADLDGDGDLDLLAADALDVAWAVTRDVAGDFGAVALPLAIDGAVSLGDFDGDGWVDLLVLDALGSGTTYLNRTDPLYPDDVAFLEVASAVDLASLGETGEPIVAASAVDHDGDGQDDLVVAYADPSNSPVYLSLASAVDAGVFEAPALWTETVPVHALAQGAFGADSDPDLLVGGAASGDPGQVYLLAGDGNLGLGGPTPAWDTNPVAEAGEFDDLGVSEFWPMDVDHDGCLDVVVTFVSDIDQGVVTELALGVALQDADMAGVCLGSFAGVNGEPDVFTWVADQPEVVAPHIP